MAVGKEIVSAFAGAADYRSFDLTTHISESKTIRPKFSECDQILNRFYKENRELREQQGDPSRALAIFEEVESQFPESWLLPLEIYELTGSEKILTHLKRLKIRRPKLARLIDDGIELVKFVAK